MFSFMFRVRKSKNKIRDSLIFIIGMAYVEVLDDFSSLSLPTSTSTLATVAALLRLNILLHAKNQPDHMMGLDANQTGARRISFALLIRPRSDSPRHQRSLSPFPDMDPELLQNFNNTNAE